MLAGYAVVGGIQKTLVRLGIPLLQATTALLGPRQPWAALSCGCEFRASGEARSSRPGVIQSGLVKPIVGSLSQIVVTFSQLWLN